MTRDPLSCQGLHQNRIYILLSRPKRCRACGTVPPKPPVGSWDFIQDGSQVTGITVSEHSDRRSFFFFFFLSNAVCRFATRCHIHMRTVVHTYVQTSARSLISMCTATASLLSQVPSVPFSLSVLCIPAPTTTPILPPGSYGPTDSRLGEEPAIGSESTDNSKSSCAPATYRTC